MKNVNNKTVMLGPRRFQWQVGGWFGSVLGGLAWLLPTAVILALNGQSHLAMLPAACFLVVSTLGALLWCRRDRLLPFPSLICVLAVFSVVTPLVWFSVSANATPVSLASLNWPQQGITAIVATLICPALIAWLCIGEYTHGNASVSPKNKSHRTSHNN